MKRNDKKKAGKRREGCGYTKRHPMENDNTKISAAGEPAPGKTRVLIADDHELIRWNLKRLINLLPNLTVVGEATTGYEAIEQFRKGKPDLIFMDISMPEMDGVEATRRILCEDPSIKILVVSVHADRRYAAAMLSLGAAGYIIKDHLADELRPAVQAVISGRKFISPKIASGSDE